MSKLRVEIRLMYNLVSDIAEKKVVKEAFHALYRNFLNSPKALEYIDADFDGEVKQLSIEFNAYTYTTEDFEPVLLPKIYNEFIRHRIVEATNDFSREYPSAAVEYEVQLYDLPGDEFNIETYHSVPDACQIATFIVDSCKYDPKLKDRLRRSGLQVDDLLQTE